MKLFFYSLAIFCIAAQNTAGQGFGISDIFNSAGTIVTGIGQEVINRIPTPDELFNVSIRTLAGLPETAIYQTISRLCSLYMAAGTIQPRITPDIDSMTIKLRASCKELSFPLRQAEQILESPDFDLNKKVAIFVVGWGASSSSDYVANMANAFNCRGNYNFLALNSSKSLDTLYTWSAYNTQAVGYELAVVLAKLVEKVPVENIHVIGHSLGAHIVGAAGRRFTELTGLHLPRITGLDPANPCFYEGNVRSGLQRGDALFIDVIHSNPGALGKAESLGDVDFYPGGDIAIKPGCSMFGCSHGRAYEYFIESVYPGNENNFLGIRCTSLAEASRGNCGYEGYPMGYAVPYNLKGNYYLNVNAEKPFGQNNNYRSAVPRECRQCEHK